MELLQWLVLKPTRRGITQIRFCVSLAVSLLPVWKLFVNLYLLLLTLWNHTSRNHLVIQNTGLWRDHASSSACAWSWPQSIKRIITITIIILILRTIIITNIMINTNYEQLSSTIHVQEQIYFWLSQLVNITFFPRVCLLTKMRCR